MGIVKSKRRSHTTPIPVRCKIYYCNNVELLMIVNDKQQYPIGYY